MKRLGLWLELFVQFLWMVFLIALIVDAGGIKPASLFLSPKFYWLLYLSLFFFVIFASNTLIKILLEKEFNDDSPAFLYLLIPMIFFTPALKADLGSKAVERRGIVFQEVQKSEEDTKKPSAPVSPSIAEGTEYKNEDGTDRFLKIFSESEQSVGRRVNLIGQAAFNPQLPEGSFYIFKFIIFCCAADATPSGFIVTGLDSTDVQTDKWYQISGTVEMTDVDGKEYLSVKGDSLKLINKPEVPFEIY